MHGMLNPSRFGVDGGPSLDIFGACPVSGGWSLKTELMNEATTPARSGILGALASFWQHDPNKQDIRTKLLRTWKMCRMTCAVVNLQCPEMYDKTLVVQWAKKGSQRSWFKIAVVHAHGKEPQGLRVHEQPAVRQLQGHLDRRRNIGDSTSHIRGWSYA